MAGRPPLRIGQHGKSPAGTSAGECGWPACRYRDSDGVTRIVERRGPVDEHDLLRQTRRRCTDRDARRFGGGAGAASSDQPRQPMVTVVGRPTPCAARRGRSLLRPPWTPTRSRRGNLRGKLLGGVRVGEATPARCGCRLAVHAETLTERDLGQAGQDDPATVACISPS